MQLEKIYKGMNIIKLKQYLIQKNYLHNGDLREYQLSKINQVLNDAQQNSLFYKNSLTKLNSLEDIKKDIFKKSIL